MSYLSEHQLAKQDLPDDYSLQWLVTTPLYNIGENVYNMSDEYKAEHEDIPWLMIAGLRHTLVHDYDGTNRNIIADVVFEELPQFAEKITNLLK